MFNSATAGALTLSAYTGLTGSGGEAIHVVPTAPIWSIDPATGLNDLQLDAGVACNNNGTTGVGAPGYDSTGKWCVGPVIYPVDLHGNVLVPGAVEASNLGTVQQVPAGRKLVIGGLSNTYGAADVINVAPDAQNTTLVDLAIEGAGNSGILMQGQHFIEQRLTAQYNFFADFNLFGDVNGGSGPVMQAGPGKIVDNFADWSSYFGHMVRAGPNEPFTPIIYPGGSGNLGSGGAAAAGPFVQGFDGFGMNAVHTQLVVQGNHVYHNDIILSDACTAATTSAWAAAGVTPCPGSGNDLVVGNFAFNVQNCFTLANGIHDTALFDNQCSGGMSAPRTGQSDYGISIGITQPRSNILVDGLFVTADQHDGCVKIAGTQGTTNSGGVTLRNIHCVDTGSGQGNPAIQVTNTGPNVSIEDSEIRDGRGLCSVGPNPGPCYAYGIDTADQGGAGSPVAVRDVRVAPGFDYVAGSVGSNSYQQAKDIVQQAPMFGLAANLPAPGNRGARYLEIDANVEQCDTGLVWVACVTPASLGALTSSAIPAGTAGATILGSSGTAGSASTLTLGPGLAIAGGSLSYGCPPATGATSGCTTFGTGSGTAAQGNDSRITGALAATAAASTYLPLSGGVSSGSQVGPIFLPSNSALRPPSATDDATALAIGAGSISNVTVTTPGVGVTSGSCAIAAPPVGSVPGTYRQATCHLLIIQGYAQPIVDDPGAGYTVNTYPAVTIADNGSTHTIAQASVALVPAFWVGSNGLHMQVSNIPGQGTWQPMPSTGTGFVDAEAGSPPLFAAGTVQQNKLYVGPAVNVQAGAAAQDIGFLDGHLDVAALDAFAAANLQPQGGLFLPLSVQPTIQSAGTGCSSGITQVSGGTAQTPIYLNLVASGGAVTGVSYYPAPSTGAYTSEPPNPVSVSQSGCSATFDLSLWNNGGQSYPTVNTLYDQGTSYTATAVSIAPGAGGSGCVSYGTEGIVGTSNPITTLSLALTATSGAITGASIVSAGAYGGVPPNPVALNPNHEPGCSALLNVTWTLQGNHNDAKSGWQVANQPITTLSGHAGTTCSSGTFSLSGGTLGVAGGTPATLQLTTAGGAITAISYVFPGVYSVPPANPVAVSGCDAQINIAGWQSTAPSISERNKIGGDRSICFCGSEAIFAGGSVFRDMMFLPSGVSVSPKGHAVYMVAGVMADIRAQNWLQLGPSTSEITFGVDQAQQTYLQSGTATTLSNIIPSQSPQFLAYNEAANAGIYDDDQFAQAPGSTTTGNVAGGTIGYSDYVNGLGGSYPGGSSIFDLTAIMITGGQSIAAQQAVKQAAYQQEPTIAPQQRDVIIMDGASNVAGHDAIIGASTPRQMQPLLRRPARLYDVAWSGASMAPPQIVQWYGQHVAPLMQYANGARVICYLSPGNNDGSGGASATTVEGYITTYVAQARQAGCTRVILATNFPNSSHVLTNSPAGVTAEWTALNAWILANSVGADAIADEGGDSIMGLAANTTNQTYFAPDGAHASDYGQSFLARIDAAAINSLH